MTLVFTILFIIFAILARCALVCTNAKKLGLLSFISNFDSVAPFVLGLLRDANAITTLIVATYDVRTVIDGVVIGVYCTLFFTKGKDGLHP